MEAGFQKAWFLRVCNRKGENKPRPPRQPPSNLPKSCCHFGRALLQECRQLRYCYSSRSSQNGRKRAQRGLGLLTKAALFTCW